MGYLGRREHCTAELFRKLAAKGYQSNDIDLVITELKSRGLQSDFRFAEAYLFSRHQRGYGPLRIQQELSEHGIEKSVINQLIDADHEDWFQNAVKVRQKKFGQQQPREYKEIARQSRFLQYRGFTHVQIKHALGNEMI